MAIFPQILSCLRVALVLAGLVAGGSSFASAATAITVSPSLLEIPIDQNGNGLIDYLSTSVTVSGSSGTKVIMRATLTSANGVPLVAADTPVILNSNGRHVNFDFSGPLIRNLYMISPFTLDISIRDAGSDAVLMTARLQLKHRYDYRRFELGR